MKTFLVVLTMLSANAFAWGPTGHRVVGAIAEKFLNIDAHLKALEILDGNSLARVSTWPDEIRSEPSTYSHTYVWHYTEWKEGDHNHSEHEAGGLLVTSIREHIDTLKNPESSKDAKAFALKFLVHLVGDLHQPLHVGNGLDRGGNACKVTFQGKATNLHAVWDEEMIEFNKLSYTELTNFVINGQAYENVMAWKEGSLVDWTLESKELRSKVYPKNLIEPSEPMSVRQYCRSDIAVLPAHMPKLGYEYSYQFMRVVEQRLFQAGLRLSLILNDALK